MSELIAVDDGRHGSIDGHNLIVNMAVAALYSSPYQNCSGMAIK